MEPPTTPATPPPRCHPKEPSVQGDQPCGGPTHRCGWRTNRKHHHSGPGGHHSAPRTSHPKPDAGPPASGHTPRPLPTAPGVAQQVGPGESHAKHGRTNRTPTAILGEVREAYDLFWSTHKKSLPQAPPRGNQAHHRPPEQVEYVPGARVPAVLLLAPNGLKTTLRPGRTRGNLWMLPPPTARNFCPLPLKQDKLTGTPTTC